MLLAQFIMAHILSGLEFSIVFNNNGMAHTLELSSDFSNSFWLKFGV